MFIHAIDLYDVVLTIHILAVVVAFGVVFAYPLIDAQLKKAPNVDLATLHRLHVALAQKVITPAMTVVLVAGLYLAIDRWSLGDPWIGATLVILIALFALTGAVLTPTDRRLAQLAPCDGAAKGAEYEAQERKAARFGSIALLLVVVAIFLMVAKPGA